MKALTWISVIFYALLLLVVVHLFDTGAINEEEINIGESNVKLKGGGKRRTLRPKMEGYRFRARSHLRHRAMDFQRRTSPNQVRPQSGGSHMPRTQKTAHRIKGHGGVSGKSDPRAHQSRAG